jgi:hypothetical protein
MQSDLKWNNLEALVRSYEYSIFAQASQKKEGMGRLKRRDAETKRRNVAGFTRNLDTWLRSASKDRAG